MAKKKTGAAFEKVYRLDVNPFNYTLEVIVTKDVQASARSRGVPITRNFAACHCGAEAEPFSQMYIPVDTPMSILAHECFHCVWHIMDIAGAEHENEVMAYTLSFLVEQIEDMVMNTRKAFRIKK